MSRDWVLWVLVTASALALGALAMASAIVMLILGDRLGYADVDPASLDAANPSTSSAPR